MNLEQSQIDALPLGEWVDLRITRNGAQPYRVTVNGQEVRLRTPNDDALMIAGFLDAASLQVGDHEQVKAAAHIRRLVAENEELNRKISHLGGGVDALTALAIKQVTLLQQAVGAMNAEMDEGWECNSYHPKLYSAIAAINEHLKEQP